MGKLFVWCLLIWSPLALAERVISLAPHLTEMMYSAGAGSQLVGVVEYSDFPPEAKTLPLVGGYSNPNYEKILSLKPDVVLFWQNGNQTKTIQRLKQLGIDVIGFQDQTLDAIPETILKLGKRFGTQSHATPIAQALKKQLSELRETYQQQSKVTTFYQIWDKPLITVGRHQFIDEAITLCGGQNIFNDQTQPAPQVSLESVLKRNPQIILLGGQKNIQTTWQKHWQQYPQLQAVKNHQIHKLNADLYQRPTARLINALPALCETLNQARNGA